jgi:hypothetical protein
MLQRLVFPVKEFSVKMNRGHALMKYDYKIHNTSRRWCLQAEVGMLKPVSFSFISSIGIYFLSSITIYLSTIFKPHLCNYWLASSIFFVRQNLSATKCVASAIENASQPLTRTT